MKVLFIGDCHIKINRFDLGLRFLDWLNKLIEEQKPDLVVNLGDFFDTHGVLRSEITTEFMNHVDKVLKLNIPYVYVLGNHDCYKPSDSKYHAVKNLVNKIPNLHIIDEPTNLFGMSFVPYFYNPDEFPTNLLPVCVAHQTFFGADYGPVTAKDGVDPARLINCEIVISGHIHKRQQLAPVTTGPTIHYVGSPFSQSAGDVDQVKGISIFDMDTYQETFISCPLPAWRRLSTVVSVSTSIEDVHNMVEQYVSNSKDHWVIELEGPKAEIVSYLSTEKYKKAIEGVDVKVKTTFTDKEKKKVSIEAKSMESIISDYIVKVYSGSLDKKELLSIAKTVLNDIKEQG